MDQNYEYALLLNPGHNRVYFEAAKEIAQKELRVLLQNTILPETIKNETIAGVDYLIFQTPDELTENDKMCIGRMSGYFALFLRYEGGLVMPVDAGAWRSFPDSLNTILKYSGKTNEQFTRLMVNLATSISKSRINGRFHLLDPMAGKGTTLFDGIIQGFNVTGIESKQKYVEETNAFFIKYLENGRYKHKACKEKRCDSKGRKIADIYQIEFGAEKEIFTNDPQKLRFFSSDAPLIGALLKKQSVDAVVCDLPYGIQHGNQNKSEKIMSRNAISLVEKILPSIHSVCKVGASVVLSFNEFTTKKNELIDALNSNDFTAVEQEYSFLHRVDQAIKRDIVIAVKN